MGTRIKLALDHNFPTPILDVLGEWVTETELVPVRRIDHRMETLEDHELVVSLAARKWAGLITCDYDPSVVPRVLSAIHQTRFRVVSIDAAGHDPLIATGALLLELPGVVKRMKLDSPQVFRLHPRSARPASPRDLFGLLAKRHGKSIQELMDAAALSKDELRDPLGP